MDKLLYPPYSARVIITGPSNVGKSHFLTKLNLKTNNEFEKTYLLIISTSRFISKP